MNQEPRNRDWSLAGDKCRKIPILAFDAKDGTILVRIPEGEFEMGDGHHRRHGVFLSEYWIGVHCVTNRQYAKFISEKKYRGGEVQRWLKPELANHPVTNVSWKDCNAYAQWAGLSLPKEAQWEKASSGPEGLIFPWGNEWDLKNCRNDKNKGNGTTAIGWDYPTGASGYGTIQQSGNVWEWCADYHESDHSRTNSVVNPAAPAGGAHRVSRGGSWRCARPSLFRSAHRVGVSPGQRSDNRGFRLVKNSPSSENLAHSFP